MKIMAIAALLMNLALLCDSQQAVADSFDFGAGYGFADSPATGAFEGGWDVIAGYEKHASAGWNIGAQLHYIKGWTDKNSDFIDTRMYFQSTALYVTARPENWWLQFSGGLVSAEYKSLMMTGSGTGFAAGAGVVLGDGNLRLHLLDYHRYMLEGQIFNVYSISIGVLY